MFPRKFILNVVTPPSPVALDYIERGSSSGEEHVPPSKLKDKIESTDTLESLKSFIENYSYVNEDKTLLMKIRRRPHAFEDFCLKSSKSWIKETEHVL